MRNLAPRAALVLAFAFSGNARADSLATGGGDFVARVEILALIQTLNASLLASRSATVTLEKWCADHHMAAAPTIVAKRLAGPDKPASAETRERLQVGPDEPLKYRHVQLACGQHVLSEADNWYVPARLTPEMNEALERSETPFGKVVQPLKPFRRTIEMKMRWLPLPDGWETGAAPLAPPMLDMPHDLFEQSALLYAGGSPISEVHETYTKEVLDFEAPAPR